MSENGIKVKIMSELHYAGIVETVAPDGLDWDDFRVFLEVVKYGSFNRAAAKLNMTQPTVSRRLIRLEKAIGVRLFERDRRGPRLTHDGRRIYTDATAAQAALNRAASNPASEAGRVDGDCKMLMGDAIASYWMTRFLPSFYDRNPGVELKLFGAYDTTTDKHATFDLHVRYYERTETEPVSIRAATVHYIPFGSREYFKKYEKPRSVEDLGEHRLLDLAVYLVDIGSLASWSHEGTPLRTALFTNLSGCLLEAVRHGAGIALLPTYVALLDEAFVPLDLGMSFPLPIYISHQRDAVKKWPVRATLDFLRSGVFDRKNMPWFADSYVPPEPDWPDRYAACVRRAAEPAIGDRRKLQSAY